MFLAESIGHFNREGLGVATKTIERFIAHAVQIYKKEPGEAFAPSRLGKFVQRWFRWFYCGITLRKKEANAVPWDIMPKSSFPDGGLIYCPASLLNKPSMITYSVDPLT